MKILKKVSVSTVLNLKSKGIRELCSSGEVAIMRIMGIVNKAEADEGDNGTFIRFRGEFNAVNLVTGEDCMSTVAFLPSPIDELLHQQIVKSTDENGNAAIQFAFEITVKESEKSTTGYEYDVNSLLETKVSDPLQALKASLAPVRISKPQEKPAEEKPVAEKSATKK